jgi:predicted dienelactone hydrolase
MIFTDVLLIAALVAFVVAWWRKRTPYRSTMLLASALLALMAGGIGVIEDRWQAGVGTLVATLLVITLLTVKLRRVPVNDRVPWKSGVAFSLLIALAGAAIWLFPVGDLPKPRGPHPVGVRTFELSDTTRPGVLHAAADEPRRLLVRVWYPAQHVDDYTARPYFTQRETDTTARSLGAIFGFPQFFTYMRHARTNSYEDAPLLAGARNLPVVLYSHGYSTFLGQNTALMEELASHGYVVYSLQHTYDSATTLFPNGDVIQTDPAVLAGPSEPEESEARMPPSLVASATASTLDERLEGHLRSREDAIAKNDRTVMKSTVTWVADRLFLHDRLQKGAVPANVAQIVAASRLDRVGEAGMSFGGATTGSVCLVDARCAAGVNLDGGDFHFNAFDADLPSPFLMFHSDLRYLYREFGVEPKGAPRGFNEFSYERIGTSGERGNLYRVQLAGTQHLGFSDFSLFLRRPVRDKLLGSAPARVMIGAQNELVRGFFDHYVRGIANHFPAPQLEEYAGWATTMDTSDLRGWWAAKSAEERAGIEARIEKIKLDLSGRPALAAVSP